MLKKYIEAPRKHQQNMFWGFLRNLENPVLGSKMWFSAQISNYAKKNLETLKKHQLNMFWGFIINFWKSGSGSKIQFSA